MNVTMTNEHTTLDQATHNPYDNWLQSANCLFLKNAEGAEAVVKIHSLVAQELLLRVGVLGHIVPLLFGYDATHDSDAQPDHFDYSGSQKAQGPAFLGLGIQRSNMQVTAE